MKFTLLGITHPLWAPHFQYREYIDAQYSLEAVVVKKAGL